MVEKMLDVWKQNAIMGFKLARSKKWSMEQVLWFLYNYYYAFDKDSQYKPLVRNNDYLKLNNYCVKYLPRIGNPGWRTRHPKLYLEMTGPPSNGRWVGNLRITSFSPSLSSTYFINFFSSWLFEIFGENETTKKYIKDHPECITYDDDKLVWNESKCWSFSELPETQYTIPSD